MFKSFILACIEADKDMKTEVLLQAGSPVDACGAITCGARRRDKWGQS